MTTKNVYFCAGKGKYMVPDKHGDWMPETRQDTVDFLIAQYGFDSCRAANNGLSAIDSELLRIRREQRVDYANSLAGYGRGLLPDMNGKAVLVTNARKAIVPVRGPWPIIKQIVNTLLASQDDIQETIFHGWMAEICKSLKSEKWRPGQILCLIGRSNNGKSLVQSIITSITGGRDADPSLYLSRRTNFNGELFAAEHLRINDEIVTCSNAGVRQLWNGLKQIAANRTHKLHDKNHRGIDLPVFWRCTMSLNDGPEDLRLLPPMDDSMADKFILLKCSAAKLPMATETMEQETQLWNAIVGEVPHYVYWLLHEFVLPDNFRSPRYGVKHFHHPEIIAMQKGQSPEGILINLIDSIGADLFTEVKRPWTGTANELKARLLRAPFYAKQDARMAFIKGRNFSDYLERLAAEFPGRVRATGNARNGTSWIVYPACQPTFAPKGITVVKESTSQTQK